ncbi:MAG TPA: SGNH/GDSL hydrolase family protein [Vicinamibacterales bacterium]|nr:SGNH/GDSL hydrolase family protein [Vicinamibacterales bacterium]
MSRRKLIVFAMITVTGAMAITTLVLLAADLYAHARVERSVGVNRHGYRGSVVPAKERGARRIVMLGGSTVFGWDVAVDDTVPALLEQLLRQRDPRVTVVNLGFIGEGAHAFLPTLQDYAYLDYDVAILYEGYNDLAGDARPNVDLLRHDSAVFRATGYFPILPLYLREKAYALRFGSVGAAYDAARNASPKTVFRPGLADRTSAAALTAAASITESLGQQLDKMAAAPVTATGADSECAAPWTHYCRSVRAAVDFVVGKQKTVLVTLQPLLKNDRNDLHAQQQRALSAMVQRRYQGQPRVRLVDVSGAVDLANTQLAFDGMHLNAQGNAIVAQALVLPVSEAAGLSGGSR